MLNYKLLLISLILLTFSGCSSSFISGIFDVAIFDSGGNEIDSLNGALNIHDADIHKIPINEYFHEHIGISTTLDLPSNHGAIYIIVVNSTGFSIGDTLQIENGVIEVTFPTITNIVGNNITLDRPLDNNFNTGDSVGGVNFNMAVLGTLENPRSFKLIPDKDQTWHIYRFLVGMIISSSADDSKFGNLPTLTNGVILRAYNAQTNTTRTFTDWKSNGDMKMDMYDLSYTDKAGGGNYGVNGRGSVRIATGATPTINGSAGDYLELLIQDDLTSLITFNQKGQGHIESH